MPEHLWSHSVVADASWDTGHSVLGGSEGLEIVAVVCCCLVASLDRLSGFPLFAIHSACLGLPSACLSPSREAPGPLHVVMGV